MQVAGGNPAEPPGGFEPYDGALGYFHGDDPENKSRLQRVTQLCVIRKVSRRNGFRVYQLKGSRDDSQCVTELSTDDTVRKITPILSRVFMAPFNIKLPWGSGNHMIVDSVRWPGTTSGCKPLFITRKLLVGGREEEVKYELCELLKHINIKRCQELCNDTGDFVGSPARLARELALGANSPQRLAQGRVPPPPPPATLIDLTGNLFDGLWGLLETVQSPPKRSTVPLDYAGSVAKPCVVEHGLAFRSTHTGSVRGRRKKVGNVRGSSVRAAVGRVNSGCSAARVHQRRRHRRRHAFPKAT